MRRKGKAPPPSRNGVCGRIRGFGKAVRTVPGNAAAHGVSDTARMALSGTMDAPPCIWALLPPRGFPKPYPEASPRALCRSPARRPPCPSEALPAHGPCRRQRGVPPRCQKRRRAPGRPRRACRENACFAWAASPTGALAGTAAPGPVRRGQRSFFRQFVCRFLQQVVHPVNVPLWRSAEARLSLPHPGGLGRYALPRPRPCFPEMPISNA